MARPLRGSASAQQPQQLDIHKYARTYPYNDVISEATDAAGRLPTAGTLGIVVLARLVGGWCLLGK